MNIIRRAPKAARKHEADDRNGRIIWCGGPMKTVIEARDSNRLGIFARIASYKMLDSERGKDRRNWKGAADLAPIAINRIRDNNLFHPIRAWGGQKEEAKIDQRKGEWGSSRKEGGDRRRYGERLLINRPLTSHTKLLTMLIGSAHELIIKLMSS